jgi:hypothetical protein
MTDETEVALVPRTNSKNDIVWSTSIELVPPAEQDAYSAALRFWAGASASGRTSLYFYHGNLTGTMYREILKEALPEIKRMLPVGSWTFMHDGAPAHSDEKTNEWLEGHVPAFFRSGPSGQWPAKSPDLNWMENIWSVMKAKVSEGKSPKDLNDLKRRLVKVWDSIPAEVFRKCAAAMPGRLKEVVEGHGHPLKS